MSTSIYLDFDFEAREKIEIEEIDIQNELSVDGIESQVDHKLITQNIKGNDRTKEIIPVITTTIAAFPVLMVLIRIVELILDRPIKIKEEIVIKDKNGNILKDDNGNPITLEKIKLLESKKGNQSSITFRFGFKTGIEVIINGSNKNEEPSEKMGILSWS